MKPGRIAILIILYYLLMVVYEILYPEFPKVNLSLRYIILYCSYYIISYGILTAVSYFGYKKTKFKCDSFALYSLYIYSIGKFVYYIIIINPALPTYIEVFNSKTVSIFISVTLWVMAFYIWKSRFNIDKIK